MTLTTKLVDGKFPDYNRVIPKDGNKVISAEREVLRQALSRTAILSNEKFRGIRLNISDQQIQLSANNPEQEEAEELVSVDYGGVELEIGFNVGYHRFFGTLGFYPMFTPDGRLVSQEESSKIYGEKPVSHLDGPMRRATTEDAA
mgnify:CR=1 FL=1